MAKDKMEVMEPMEKTVKCTTLKKQLKTEVKNLWSVEKNMTGVKKTHQKKLIIA